MIEPRGEDEEPARLGIDANDPLAAAVPEPQFWRMHGKRRHARVEEHQRTALAWIDPDIINGRPVAAAMDMAGIRLAALVHIGPAFDQPAELRGRPIASHRVVVG